MEAYNEIVPDAAERILVLLETQVAHRQDLEQAVIRGNLSAQRLGQVTAFIVTMTAVLSGTWLSS